MKNTIILGVLFVSMALVSQSYAQSGSRGAVGGGGARVASGARSTGGVRASGGGSGIGSSFGGARLSRAERQRLAQQHAQLRQQQALQLAQVRAEQSKQQFKQVLSQLASDDSRSVNSRQNRYAYQEAKRDYQSLRKRQLAPDQLGPLQQPFRLTGKDIDRESFTAHWPDLLQEKEFDALVEPVDKAIMERAVDDQESAIEFLDDLSELNSALNTAAVEGRVNITNFAKARRFITGLANEVRATGLVM